MTIRRLDGQTPVVPTTRPTETQPANTVKPAPAAAPTATVAQSGFSEAKRAPTDSTGASARTAALPGPLSPSSPEGQAAVKATVDFLNQQGGGQALSRGGSAADASKAFTPRTIERDELGMTHVRLDRTHEGVKVFGEQVIGHLDAQGKMDSVTGETSHHPRGPGHRGAQAVLQGRAGGCAEGLREPDGPQALRGEGHLPGRRRQVPHRLPRGAHQHHEPDRAPRRQNYLIDGETGKVVEKFNQMGGIELPGKRAAADAPTTVTGSAAPNAEPSRT